VEFIGRREKKKKKRRKISFMHKKYRHTPPLMKRLLRHIYRHQRKTFLKVE
jgi:hypothetical protein